MTASAPIPADVGRFLEANRRTFMITLRKDGSPTGHPVSVFSGGGFFINMYTASLKSRNLARDGRTCCVVTTPSEAERFTGVLLRGRARPLPADEALASGAPAGLASARNPAAEGLSDVAVRIENRVRTIYEVVPTESGTLERVRRPKPGQGRGAS